MNQKQFDKWYKSLDQKKMETCSECGKEFEPYSNYWKFQCKNCALALMEYPDGEDNE